MNAREQVVEALKEIEMYCPCGARPESLGTHPHVSGCPVERALALMALMAPAEGAGEQQSQIDFDNGRIRRREGARLIDNPYPRETQGAADWERGWKVEHYAILKAEDAKPPACECRKALSKMMRILPAINSEFWDVYYGEAKAALSRPCSITAWDKTPKSDKST